MNARRLSIALAILAAVHVAPARAQQPAPLQRPDAIPTDLATALISAGGLGGEPQILVGAIPAWITGRLFIPKNARVMGSAFLGSSLVTVLSFPVVSDSIVPEMTRELMKLGWSPPPPAQFMPSGFVPASMAPGRSAVRGTFCNDQQVLTISGAPRHGMTTEVTMRVNSVANYSPCRPQQAPLGMYRPPYPTLYNPADAADARMSSECSSSSNASSATSTALKTPMSPEALLDHYGKQLADSGWKAGATDQRTMVTRSWTRTDSTGAPMEIMISAATTSKDVTCRDLNLTIRRAQKP